MTGFDQSLQRAILGFEPHLKVSNGQSLEDWRGALEAINQIPGVVGSAPYGQGPVMMERNGRVHTPVMRGINIGDEQKLLDLRKFVDEKGLGKVDDLTSDTAILGMALARELGVEVGETIKVYAPANVDAIMAELQRLEDDPEAKPKTLQELKGEVVFPATLKVVGIFNSGLNSYDSAFVLVPLFLFQELYQLDDAVHGISVKTTDPFHAGEVQRLINERLEGSAVAVSWYEENSQRFDAIRMERHVMFVILMFLIVIAAFGITSTLITVTVQKTREIGIMKALGAETRQIIWVFLAQGMFVGFFGTLTGLALGLTALYYRNPFKEWLSGVLEMEIFPSGIYEFEGIPAEVVPRDVVVICISAFAICSVAALIPAWFAARLDPVKALRAD
jgi:lipoprotein-releasing system permease protein